MCDWQTLRKLMSYFGPLERFNILELASSVDHGYKSMDEFDSEGKEKGDADHESLKYPSPHDAPRCSSMDAKCWEVKWAHRDDCVSALMVILLFELLHSMNDVPLNFRLLSVSLTLQ